MQQHATLTSRDDQLLVRTPWGEIFVVSAQEVGEKKHVYITPPEGFKQIPGQGVTTIFER